MTSPETATVLLIEESATLRYALEKQPRANHYAVQVAHGYAHGGYPLGRVARNDDSTDKSEVP